MTSVPPTQPPAAPETDVVAEVGAYAQQKEATARAVNDAARMAQIAARRTRELAAMAARAESAEAAHRALRAAVEALADEWASSPDDRRYDGDRARALRALLAGGAR